MKRGLLLLVAISIWSCQKNYYLEDLQAAEDTIVILTQDKDELQQQIDNLTAQLNQLLQEANADAIQIRELNSQIEELTARINIPEDSNTPLEIDTSSLEITIAQLQEEIARLNGLIEEKDALIAEYVAANAILTQENERLRALILELNATIESQNTEIVTQREVIESLVADIEYLVGDVNEKVLEIRDLRTVIETLEGEVIYLADRVANSVQNVAILEDHHNFDWAGVVEFSWNGIIFTMTSSNSISLLYPDGTYRVTANKSFRNPTKGYLFVAFYQDTNELRTASIQQPRQDQFGNYDVLVKNSTNPDVGIDGVFDIANLALDYEIEVAQHDWANQEVAEVIEWEGKIFDTYRDVAGSRYYYDSLGNLLVHQTFWPDGFRWIYVADGTLWTDRVVLYDSGTGS